MIMSLGRSRNFMVGRGGNEPHCEVTCCGSTVKMGQNGGSPKSTEFPGNKPVCSCFWWIIEGNFAD